MVSRPSYVIGVDIGTTSTKSVLFHKNGDVIQKCAISYPLYSPTPATAEQNPREIFAAVIQTVKQVVNGLDPSDILCLSFSAAMHTLILLNAAHQLISNSITWADNRSAKWASQLKASRQGLEIYHRTGTPIHSMSPLVKLIWLRHEQPILFAQATHVISIKEYVFYQLFQQYVVDHSIASATGLLNLDSLSWDAEALSLAGIEAKQLSELVPTTHVLQGMQPDWAEAMGLRVDVPVVVGANDGVLASLGMGAIAPGIVAVTVGTSGAVRAVVERPKTDPEGILFCYALTQKHWVIGGATNNGGITLRWVRDQLAATEISTAKSLGQDPYEMLIAIAQTIPPGANGLIFHPYLTGERSPLWDANAKASFIGLGLHHHKAHMIRAVLEGVIYNLYLILETLEITIGQAYSIRAAGGFARSALWRQMLADIFNQEVIVPESYESSCLGAAVLGLYALGYISDLAMVTEMIGVTHRHQPFTSHVVNYQKIIPIYRRLLDKLKTEYAILAQLQDELG